MFRNVGVFVSMMAIALAGGGCGSLNGPSIDYTAPKVTGRVVNETNGAPVAYARVGRRLFTWRKPGGEFMKGGEELTGWQDYARTSRNGEFTLPRQQVALLFSFGDLGVNLNLSVQHGGYHAWQTNFPLAALSTNNPQPEIEGVEVRLRPK
jgi:hypothetical protein